MAGFVGAAFFLILAPTTLVPGVTQMIVEHRMYLPLAGVIVLIVALAVGWLGRGALIAFAGLSIVAGVATARRNADYQTDLTLWADTVRKRPQSAAGQSGLATAYYQRGDFAQALAHYDESLRVDAGSAKTQFNRGLTLDKLARVDEAVSAYREAIRLMPRLALAHASLGEDLKQQKYVEALEHLQVVVENIPQLAAAYAAMGVAFERLGDLPRCAVIPTRPMRGSTLASRSRKPAN